MNILNFDGCSSTCKLEAGWTCTAAAASAPGVGGVCTTICGDGIVVDSSMAINKPAQAENCDDGIGLALTGCAATCKAGDKLGYQCSTPAPLAGTVCVA